MHNHVRQFGRLAWSCVKGGRAVNPQVEAGTWAGRLEAEKENLLSLVMGMEAEFLSTGQGLMRLSQQLNEIQKECQALTELTQGHAQDPAVQFAFQLLKKIEDLLLAYDQYDHVLAVFSDLQRWLFLLPKQHEEMMRRLLPLNFITAAFRIEASRFPVEVQQAFCTLAANVTRTVHEVRAALGCQFEELAASERIAEALMERVSASIQQHRKTVAATLASSRDQLAALKTELCRAGTGAAQLAQLNQIARRHIGTIVLAQQCQDLTRQKIEHVGEAMDEMRAHLRDAGSTAAKAETRQFIFQAAQIQLQQMQNVFAELIRAAECLQSGIQNLRTDCGSAAAAAIQVGGTLLDAKIATQCQASMGEIFTILPQAVQKNHDILAAFEPLRVRFGTRTNPATKLTNDVRYAALNAQVFAIHAVGGATLEVLAGQMRTISDEVMQQMGKLEDALKQTAEMVDDLQQRLVDFGELSQLEQEVLVGESVLSRKKLTDLEGAIPVLIQRIARQQETFAQSVEQVLIKVQFPVSVAQARSRSLGFFQELVTWGNEGHSGLLAQNTASQKIDRLRSKYTMDSERHAHSVALQPMPATASAPAFMPATESLGEPERPLATSLFGGGAPPNEQSANQSCLLPSSAPGESVGGTELGANVELF